MPIHPGALGSAKIERRSIRIMPAAHGGVVVTDDEPPSCAREILFAGEIDATLKFVAEFYRPAFVVDQDIIMPDLTMPEPGAFVLRNPTADAMRAEREFDEGVKASMRASPEAVDREALIRKLEGAADSDRRADFTLFRAGEAEVLLEAMRIRALWADRFRPSWDADAECWRNPAGERLYTMDEALEAHRAERA